VSVSPLKLSTNFPTKIRSRIFRIASISDFGIFGFWDFRILGFTDFEFEISKNKRNTEITEITKIKRKITYLMFDQGGY
jgi:hypothetical protein